MTKNNPPILLTDTFADWAEDKGIFSEMDNPPWVGVVDASLLDMDYFGNHSGWKKCAPLVYRLMDDEYLLSDSARKKLADLALAKFGPNWAALWDTYHMEYDPIQDYTIDEYGESEGADSRSKQRTLANTETNSETGSLTHGKQVTRNGSTTQSDDATVNYGEEVDVNTTTDNITNQSRWGFNSSVDPVPTDRAVLDGEGTNETVHSGSDTSERDFSETKSDTEVNSGTDATTSAGTRQNNGTDNGSESGTESGSYEKHISGIRGNFSRQQLIEQERALWLEDYFARIYRDLDTILASMIYNREHRSHPYYPVGFGYYSI